MEVGGSGETGLFIHGKEALEGAMLYGGVVEDGQSGGHADAVVGSKGGAVADEPAIFHKRLDGLGEEVKVLVAVFLAHHVHVGLEAYAGRVLIAFVGGFAYQDIAYLVDKCLIAVLAAEFLQVGGDFFFVFGWTGNIHQFAKVVPYGGGLEVFDCCIHGVVWGLLGLKN